MVTQSYYTLIFSENREPGSQTPPRTEGGFAIFI